MIAFAAFAVMPLAGCETAYQIRDDCENAFASPEFLAIRNACSAGDVRACEAVATIRADRSRRAAAAAGTPSSVGSGMGSGNVAPNAYGPGVGMDQFGRAVTHDPMLRVKPNAYGPGIGMDQYGRPVQ